MLRRLNISTDVIFGHGAGAEFKLPLGTVLFVHSASVDNAALATLEKGLSRHTGAVTRVQKPPGEPASRGIDEAFSKAGTFSSVLAIGGGSTLDFAKALALLGGSGGGIVEYEFGVRKVQDVKPMYLAPTTCGSGSEVTPYAVVNNSVTGRKFTLNHPSLRATQAAIDPSFLERLPDDIILSTALDAFTHCLEALLTRADTQLIWPIAMQGLQIAWRRLQPDSRAAGGIDYLTELARLSLFGGISIAHSRTGLIHTLSVAFAQFCKIPHGLLNSRLLPFAIRHSLDCYGGLLQRVIGEASGKSLNSDQEAYNVLLSWLREIVDCDPPLATASIIKYNEALVKRLLQDTGLSLVCHGDVSEAGLNRLIEGIHNA